MNNRTLDLSLATDYVHIINANNEKLSENEHSHMTKNFVKFARVSQLVTILEYTPLPDNTDSSNC